MRAGIHRPSIADCERALLNNVTSGLYNHREVKEALERSIQAVCGRLGVPVPPTKGKGRRVVVTQDTNPPAGPPGQGQLKDSSSHKALDTSGDGPAISDEAAQAGNHDGHQEGVGPINSEEEENAVAELDGLLASEPDEYDDGDSDTDSLGIPEIRGFKPSNTQPLPPSLGELSISGSESPEESEEDYDESDTEEDLDGDGVGEEKEAQRTSTISASKRRPPSPPTPPPPKRSRSSNGNPTQTSTTLTSSSTFLPSLLNGYISGSDGDSPPTDIDERPKLRKNRRGQRERQKIWEKKYGANAKHKGAAAGSGNASAGAKDRKCRGNGAAAPDERTQGWDARKGAVGSRGDAKKAPSWKRGSTVAGRDRRGGGGGSSSSGTNPVAEPKSGEDGHRGSGGGKGTGQSGGAPRGGAGEPMHPSWAAAVARKEREAKAAAIPRNFESKALVFDD